MADSIKVLAIHMPDGAIMAVPVDVIARNRAEQYADEFGGDVERSLAEDTLPLFESDTFAIEDWAANDMNWDELEPYAREIRTPKPPNYAAAWRMGRKRCWSFRKTTGRSMNTIEHLLACLAEEGGEIAQAAGKAGRFGLQDTNPSDGISNQDRLVQEINDALSVAELLQEEGVEMLGVGDRAAIEAKKAKVRRYMAYARDRGTLAPRPLPKDFEFTSLEG